MIVGILSRSHRLYTTGRLVESAGRAGHEARVINPLLCSLGLSRGQPGIFYRGTDRAVPLGPEDLLDLLLEPADARGVGVDGELLPAGLEARGLVLLFVHHLALAA